MNKIGIIGCGRMAEKHIETIQQLDDITIIALSDISTDRMGHVHNLISSNAAAISMHTNYEEMLKLDSIDIILITTTSGLHAEIAEKALRARKHVIVEKPLTLSLEEARKLTALANQVGRHLFVCYQLRYRKLMLKIKELIDSELLGTVHYGIVTMAINRSQAYFDQASWRGTWEHDGGMLINQGIHFVDLLVWYLGDLENIYGEITRVNNQKQTEDIALGLLTFKNGAKGLIEANIITLPENFGYSIRLFAEKGTIIISGKQLDQIERFEISGQTYSDQELDDLKNDRMEHLTMYQEIITKIKGNEQGFPVDGQESEKALEAIFALYASVLQKKKVSLPLSSFSSGLMKQWNNES
ncbi:Gfo/Idh/MocA family protein [Ornithinibacillus contaminans]|uniref:Gfo/Idh/MocA family protein n=1 Tax=Ornithinibacillus contaminans TaxID=694055 RepID=UPI00064DF0A1|nr:Gfo/Idh/MocA family oxidoreductase [Ornithinibacillus contaminans]